MVLRRRAGHTEAESTAAPSRAESTAAPARAESAAALGLLNPAAASSPQIEVGIPLTVVGNHLDVVDSPCSHPEA